MIKPIKQTPARTHRKFDQTFKRQAVANWLSSGESLAAIAARLGVAPLPSILDAPHAPT